LDGSLSDAAFNVTTERRVRGRVRFGGPAGVLKREDDRRRAMSSLQILRPGQGHAPRLGARAVEKPDGQRIGQNPRPVKTGVEGIEMQALPESRPASWKSRH